MTLPVLDDDSGLLQVVEDLAIEQFIAKLRVKALAIAILPRAARFDIGGPRPNSCNPLLHSPRNERRALIRPDIAWRAPQDKQVQQHVDHRSGVEFAINADRKTLPHELVDHVQHGRNIISWQIAHSRTAPATTALSCAGMTVKTQNGVRRRSS